MWKKLAFVLKKLCYMRSGTIPFRMAHRVNPFCVVARNTDIMLHNRENWCIRMENSKKKSLLR